MTGTVMVVDSGKLRPATPEEIVKIDNGELAGFWHQGEADMSQTAIEALAEVVAVLGGKSLKSKDTARKVIGLLEKRGFTISALHAKAGVSVKAEGYKFVFPDGSIELRLKPDCVNFNDWAATVIPLRAIIPQSEPVAVANVYMYEGRRQFYLAEIGNNTSGNLPVGRHKLYTSPSPDIAALVEALRTELDALKDERVLLIAHEESSEHRAITAETRVRTETIRECISITDKKIEDGRNRIAVSEALHALLSGNNDPTLAHQPVTAGLEKIVEARKKHVDAVNVYNARLALVRAEREKGNWSMRLDREIRAAWDAQAEFIRAAQDVADAALKSEGGNDAL